MKNIQLALLTITVSTNFIMAGGDFIEVTPYEVADVKAAEVIDVIIPPTPVPVPSIVAVVPPVVISTAADISPLYVGIGIAAARYDTNCGCLGNKSGVDKTGGVLVKAGYDFNEYMGIEARALVTSIKPNGGKVKHLGVFAKPMYPVTDGLNTYGLVGIAKTTTQGTLRRTDVTGLAFGAGIEYDLSSEKKKDAKYDREFDGQGDQEKGFGIFADYERLYYKKGSPDLDAVSVGLTYDF